MTTPAAHRFERNLFSELRKLIPQAIEQAKQGKPALLRLLVRSLPRQAREGKVEDLGTRATRDLQLSQEVSRQWKEMLAEEGEDTKT